jgi:ribonuclease R
MQKAVYSPEPEGHYALHSDHYCHFTSPIRRYPDLTIHRMLQSVLSGKRPPNDFDQFTVLGEHCSQREQRAEAAERELTRVKLLSYLSKHIGRQMDVVITGVERFGLFAQGLKLPAEGFIHINALQDDYYEYDPRTHSLTGHRQGNQFRLGDVLRVEVARVDVDRRELDYRFIARKRKPAASGAAKSPSRKTTKKRSAVKKKKAPRKKAPRRRKRGG